MMTTGLLKTGVSFGLTSGIITTLGLMVGLHAGTHSALAVIGGIVTIAVADALSDALGIHISKEAEARHTDREIWSETIATFFTKLLVALTFLPPVVFFELSTAIVVSVVWGLGLLAFLSFHLARARRISPWSVIGEHLVIGLAVITVTHLLGDWVALTFR